GRSAVARLARCCVAPPPVRGAHPEASLRAASLADLEDAARAAAEVAAAGADAADDLHGSADYKRAMVAVFVRRALGIAAARARGAQPAARFPHAVGA